MKSKGNKLQAYIALVGLSLTVVLDLLKNSISLPSWMSPMILFLLMAFIILWMFVEATKMYMPPNLMQRRQFVFSGGVLGLLTILGGFLIVEDEDVTKKMAQLGPQLDQLRIGLLPIGDDPGGEADTSHFANSLGNLLGIPVTSESVGKTYTDTVKALASGRIEVAWLGAFSYMYAHRKYGAKVILCRLTEQGQSTYKSYIITNVNTGIRTLQDLKGRQFAFVDPLSTSGNLVPRYELKKAGIDPDKDIQAIYGSSHEDVLQGVLSGRFLAGAVSSNICDAYQKGLQQGAQQLFIVFKSMMDIPEGPIVLRRDIQPYDGLRIEDAFLTIGESDRAILNTVGIAGFAKATDDTYKGLIDVANQLNIDISNYNG